MVQMVKTKENLESSQRTAEQHSIKTSMNDIIKNKGGQNTK